MKLVTDCNCKGTFKYNNATTTLLQLFAPLNFTTQMKVVEAQAIYNNIKKA